MLQSLRENLKGSVAVVVIAIFVVPLVLFGVEQMFVGSVGGTDAAEVNGEGISALDLQREIQLEKQRLAQQFNLEPNSPQLEDELLREPVLRRMTQRLALLQAAEEAGMGASKDELWRQITQVDAFAVNGKFDYEVFKQRISGLYTPATYLNAVAKDFIIGHLNAGIAGSSFLTPSELAVIASITQQQRDFYALTIPAVDKDKIKLEESEIESFYQANQSRFMTPEAVKVEYVELSVDNLAEAIEPSEEDIRAVYEDEKQNFEARPKHTVAHILIEDDANSQAEVAAVQQQLEQGANFEELAATASDDLGSKSTGGLLGEVVEDAYPQEFVAAVQNLKVGEVSGPVKTEAGTHFIKLISQADSVPPTFEERRAAIARQVSRTMAQEQFASGTAELDELTFGDADLAAVAERLNLPLKESEPFSRSGGTGIASFDEVAEAAFSDEVLKQKYNSRVLELSGQRAVVLRVKEHQPESLQPLAQVQTQIEAELKNSKAQEMEAQQAQRLLSELQAGGSPKELAAERGDVTHKTYENVDRSTAEVDPTIIQQAFSLPRPDATGTAVLNSVALPSGGYAVVGLTAVRDGSIDDLSPQEVDAIKSQVSRQIGQVELIAFENSVLESAEIEAR